MAGETAPPISLEAPRIMNEVPLLAETREFTQNAFLNKGLTFHETRLAAESTLKIGEKVVNKNAALLKKVQDKHEWAKEITMEAGNALDYLGGLQQLKDKPAYAKGYKLTTSDGKHDMRVTISSGPGGNTIEADTNSTTLILPGQERTRLLAVTGKVNGNFIVSAENGKLLEIPGKAFYEIYTHAHRDQLMSALPPAERAAAQAYFDQQQDPSKSFDMDRNVLVEAAKSNGKILNESLTSFMDVRLPEQKPPANATPEQITAIEEYNKKRNELYAGLKTRVVATPEDMASVMALYGPTEIDAASKTIKAELIQLEQRLGQVRGTPQEAVISAQIAEKNAEMERLNAATKIYEDPKQLVEIFGALEKGTVPAAVGAKMNELIAKGEMMDAMQAYVGEKFNQLDEKKKAEILRKAKMDDANKLLAITGGGILVILMFIMEAMKGGK